MTTLPSELWLIIFDIVIEEAIISLEHCDYTTFPYIQTFLSSPKHYYQLYESYRRLRLVCRRFNALLGDRPSQSFWDSTEFPLPTSTRALYLNLVVSYAPELHRLLEERSACGRLVCLDVTCVLFPSPSQMLLSDFLAASAGQAFPNVRRLSLRIMKTKHWNFSFWARLHRAFPLLVTLVITAENMSHRFLSLSEMTSEIVTFETVETLYISGTIVYAGCSFPRLRHASIISRDRFSAMRLLKLSPYLESLVVQTNSPGPNIDMRSFSHLRSLGVPEYRLRDVVRLDRDHPLERLWLLSYIFPDDYGEYRPFKEILKNLPGISQIIIQPSLALVKGREPRIEDFGRTKLASTGLYMMPSTYGDHIIVLGRSNLGKDGILKRFWSQMRR
jgi:hypothetical protein